MCVFMAGAMTSGASVASAVVVSMSSARPCASLAITLAVHGTIVITSASSASETWCTLDSASSAQSDVATGSPVSVRNVSALTNRVAASVITTLTEKPLRCSSRTSSQLLYAPMPPVTPTSTRGLSGV